MPQILQGAFPIPCVSPEEPGIWLARVGLYPATWGHFPSLALTAFCSHLAFPIQCLQSCALSSLLFCCLSLPCAQEPHWAHAVLALGWEHWLCQWGLVCKLQGECGNRAEKNHCNIQFCISVVRKSDGKVICYCGCGCEPGWARWWWWGPETPLVQGRVMVSEVQGTFCVPVGSILGHQSLKPLVTSQGSRAVQCPGMLQQRMHTK